MIRLYHCVSARSFRALWMLEELELPYELAMLPFPPRMLARPYLDINPLGTVPLMVNGETRMTESVAICHYLCAKAAPTPLQVEPAEPEFGSWFNFLHFGEATLTFPQTLVLRYSHLEPADRRQPGVAEDYARWFAARLRTLEPWLAARPYLCAGRFTAADFSVGYALMLAGYLDLSDRFPPSVCAYWERLRSRPAFDRALQAQEGAAVAQDVSAVPAPLCRPAEQPAAATMSPKPV